jgi:hypothetical protein
MKNRQPKVRINTTISGEPARILIELKNRGIATSNTDAIIQALFTLYDKIVERDLKTAQLRTLREVEE